MRGKSGVNRAGPWGYLVDTEDAASEVSGSRLPIMLLSIFSPSAWRWKLRQLYSRLRAALDGGIFIYPLPDGARFAVLSGDLFSEALFVSRGHEVKEMAWCRAWLRAGDTAIDCGANIGYWTAGLVQTVEGLKVLAVEGNSATAGRLRRVIERLRLPGVTVHEGILSASETEKLTLPTIAGREPWQRATADEAGTNAITLDALSQEAGFPTPALVKIDCEGYEVNILRGATRMLGTVRPAFMIECNESALEGAGTTVAALFQLLAEARYSCFYLASFAGPCQPGAEIVGTPTATEFNFAAIPLELVAGERWTQSLAALGA